jgi:hypothetical protein
MNTYNNDSLNFSFKYAGDYIEVSKKGRKRTIRELRRKGIQIQGEQIIHCQKTYIEPELFFVVLLFDKSDFRKNNLILDSIIVNESQLFTYKSIAIQNGRNVCIVAYSKKDVFENLKRETRKHIFSGLCNHLTLTDEALKDPVKLAFDGHKESDSIINYLKPIAKLEALRNEYVNTEVEYSYIQALATQYACFTNLNSERDSLVNLWRQGNYMSHRDEENVRIRYRDEDATNYLLSEAQNRQVVMFNENHFIPEHRLLLSWMLDDFYKQGFRYLAVEGLWVDSIVQPNMLSIRKESGYYTRIPELSNMLYKASELGFYILGYDHFKGDREGQQARNIYEKVLQKDPDARILVWAGFGHISERTGGNRPMMAARFKELSSIDPLTIDQCDFVLKNDAHIIGVIESETVDSLPRVFADIHVSNRLNVEHYHEHENTRKISVDLNQYIDENDTFPIQVSFIKSKSFIEHSERIPYLNYFVRSSQDIREIELYLPEDNFKIVIQQSDEEKLSVVDCCNPLDGVVE